MILVAGIFIHNFNVVLIVVGSSDVDIAVLKITILNNQILDHQFPLTLFFLYTTRIRMLLFLTSMRSYRSLSSAFIPKWGAWNISVILLGLFTRVYIVLAVWTTSSPTWLLIFRIWYLCLSPQTLSLDGRFHVRTWW